MTVEARGCGRAITCIVGATGSLSDSRARSVRERDNSVDPSRTPVSRKRIAPPALDKCHVAGEHASGVQRRVSHPAEDAVTT